jgi:hypothetical protein
MGKSDSESGSGSSSEEEKKEKKEKKVKTKKPKVVMLQSQSYSKRYDSLYNNKKYSDFTVKFESGSEPVSCHKFVLGSNSEFFEKLEGNEFTFPKEDDEKAVVALLNFYYSGSLDYSDESSVVAFMLLAK